MFTAVLLYSALHELGHSLATVVFGGKVVEFHLLSLPITELAFILDHSGLMAGLESDTIGGFNLLIRKQKKQRGECFVSTVLFDAVSEVLHDRVKLSEIPKMTERDYFTRGVAALIDAIGDAIHHIGYIHKYAGPEDVPEHTRLS